MISLIKSIFLASFGILQITYEKGKKIHEGFIYGQGVPFYKQKMFKKKLVKKEVLKDLAERGEFLIDFTKLKGSEFGNKILEGIEEFFDIKSDMKKKVENFYSMISSNPMFYRKEVI